MKEKDMKILGKAIPLTNDYLDIKALRFLKDNPRVYACTHGEPNFDSLTDEEQQNIIFKKLLQEPSVKNLKREVKRHGGLMEPILVRHDTMEVIEGNSRLAVYGQLQADKAEGEWDLIPCDIVSKLTEDEQAAFLNQIHVKGKTQWSAYEKANFAYVRKERGWNVDKIAGVFGESEGTIRTRVKVIEMMKHNKDNERSHFSYYDVLVRSKEISDAMKNEGLSDFLLTRIKSFGPNDEDGDFTAQELRKKLPVILKKPKMLTKYTNGEIELDEAYQLSRTSPVEEKVKQARNLLNEVPQKDVLQLAQNRNRFNALKQEVKKLNREIERINKMLESIET
ncbi:MAG: hypothetical protein OXF39_08750 [Nitrospira sp.]|nr:hypothetical protein [Nitrospira sp.]